MNDFITAALVGFSFGNLWLCVLLTYTLQTTDRRVCAGFLIGRLFAVLILAVTVSLLGHLLPIPLSALQIISGTILLLYSIYVGVRYLFLKGKKTHHSAAAKNSTNCSHDCGSCIKSDTKELCDACHQENGDCLAEPRKIQQLSFMTDSGKKCVPAVLFGVQLGLFRGSVLCGKLMLLFPLLVRSSTFHALEIALIFTFTSSIYPVMGFFLGQLAMKLIRFKRITFFLSTILLAAISSKYIIDGFLAWK